MYKYEFVPETLEGDYIFKKNNVQIVVDKLSQQFINGCMLDFIEELGNSYFEIKNPIASTTCGCRNSFSI
jgi:iron-sulfur cluster assembly accessory protein